MSLSARRIAAGIIVAVTLLAVSFLVRVNIGSAATTPAKILTQASVVVSLNNGKTHTFHDVAAISETRAGSQFSVVLRDGTIKTYKKRFASYLLEFGQQAVPTASPSATPTSASPSPSSTTSATPSTTATATSTATSTASPLPCTSIPVVGCLPAS